MKFSSKLIKSITDIKKYNYFRMLSLKSTLLYLFFVTLIFGFISYIPQAYNYYTFLDILEKEITHNFPDFTFDGKELIIQGKQPTVLMSARNIPIYIDTTNKTSEGTIKDYEKVVAVFSNKIIYKTSNYKIDEFNYDIFNNYRFKKSSFTSMIYSFKMASWLIVILGPLMFYAMNLFMAFSAAIIAILFNAVFNGELSFKEIFNISIHAMTLPIIINCLVRIVYMVIPAVNYVLFFITLVYIYFAIKYISYRKQIIETV